MEGEVEDGNRFGVVYEKGCETYDKTYDIIGETGRSSELRTHGAFSSSGECLGMSLWQVGANDLVSPVLWRALIFFWGAAVFIFQPAYTI